MQLLFDIFRGIGFAGSVGVRPFLPAFLVGLAARADVGLSFDGTGYRFLESWPFLAAVAVCAVLTWAFEARAGGGRSGEGHRVFSYLITASSVVLGALLFGASLADSGHPSWPGLLAGAAFAGFARAAVVKLLAGAARRVGAEVGPLVFAAYAEPVALLLAALSILLPPITPLALVAFAYILVSSRARASRKYEGLRVLRKD